MTHYSKKQAAIDKAAREQYKKLVLKTDKLQFMATAQTGAIYLCDLNSDAEDMGGAWFAMLGGFQVADGEYRPSFESKAEAIIRAEWAKATYVQRLAAHIAQCAELQA